MSATESSADLPNLDLRLQVVGPILVLATLALSGSEPLLCFVGALGFAASFLWKIRGFAYSLFFLGLAALCEHIFLTQSHLYTLGLEGSYIIAFFITALSSEEKSHTFTSLHTLLEARDRSIQNVEEELAKSKEEAICLQLALQEKIGDLQKSLEEIQSDHSSVLVLNEVLRKTGAGQKEALGIERQEKEAFWEKLTFLEREVSDLHRENERLLNEGALAKENRELGESLNQARVELEQATLVNEALAKAHSKESGKAKEATQCATAQQIENQELARALERSQAELLAIESHVQQMQEQGMRYQAIEKSLEVMQTERNALKERLEQAQIEVGERSREEFLDLEKKVAALVHIEALYKQLKVQFIEKQEVLHQTRSELFLAETQLQTARIETEQKVPELKLAAGEVCTEIEVLERQISELEAENEEFESLVSHLFGSSELGESVGRKKKVKTDPEQSLLF